MLFYFVRKTSCWSDTFLVSWDPSAMLHLKKSSEQVAQTCC